MGKRSFAPSKDYLSERKQRVKIGDIFSKWKGVKRGAPQGSVLGSVFLNIFINESLSKEILDGQRFVRKMISSN